VDRWRVLTTCAVYRSPHGQTSRRCRARTVSAPGDHV
jgi:hypothetical protein